MHVNLCRRTLFFLVPINHLSTPQVYLVTFWRCPTPSMRPLDYHTAYKVVRIPPQPPKIIKCYTFLQWQNRINNPISHNISHRGHITFDTWSTFSWLYLWNIFYIIVWVLLQRKGLDLQRNPWSYSMSCWQKVSKTGLSVLSEQPITTHLQVSEENNMFTSCYLCCKGT